MKNNQQMSSAGGAKYSFVFFPPGNWCDIASTNLAYVALLSLAEDREKNKFGVWELASLCLAISIWMCFVLLWQHSHVFGRGHRKMFRAAKVHSPFPTEHSLPGAKLLWFKNLARTRRGMCITSKISLNLLECKKYHQSLQDFLR